MWNVRANIKRPRPQQSSSSVDFPASSGALVAPRGECSDAGSSAPSSDAGAVVPQPLSHRRIHAVPHAESPDQLTKRRSGCDRGLFCLPLLQTAHEWGYSVKDGSLILATRSWHAGGARYSQRKHQNIYSSEYVVQYLVPPPE